MEKKNIVYVGGLDDSVSEEILHAAFIPFGELKSVQIPKNYQANKHRGFGFVEFDSEDDAADAIDNMDGSELFGRVIRCSHAKAITKVAPGKALWNDEEWIKAHMDEDERGGEEAAKEEDNMLSS